MKEKVREGKKANREVFYWHKLFRSMHVWNGHNSFLVGKGSTEESITRNERGNKGSVPEYEVLQVLSCANT